MVVTTLHKLIGLSVAMLGQAPGTDLLNQWTRLYTQSREDGLNAMAALQKVAQHILDSDAFAEVHPAYLIIEDSDFAQRFLDSVLGETASAEVVALVVGLLEGGTSRAEVAVRAVEYLLEVNHQGSDHADYATFGTYAMRFGNQVEVARYYTVDKVWMTPDGSVLNEVDDTAASVTAAKSDIDDMQQPGKNFTLTTGVDQFTGTPGNDTFVATESTLNGADRLHGKGGMDTLELNSGSGANADISIPRGAAVEDIETLSVTSDGKFTGDVSQWTGLKTVKLEVVKDVDLELDADAGIKVTSESLGDDEDASKVTIENAGMVELKEVSKHAQVNIMGEGTTSVMVQGGKGVDVNTAASPSLTLKSVTLDGVHDGMGKDGKRYGTGENKDSVPVHIYSKAIEEITLRNTNTTLLVQNDDKDMTELTAMVDRFGNTANGHGKLCLKGIEDVMLKVAGDSNIRLASDQIKQVEVSGAGDLHLHVTKFAPAVAEKAADLKASTTLESLMLSGSGKFTLDAMGLSKLMTVDAGDATGAVEIKNLGNSVKEYTGSMGKDTVTVAAFNSKGLMADLGDGDDTFTVDNLAAGKSKIDGGAGMDTLVLKQKVGANLKGAGDSYTGFETITLEAGQGEGVYDIKGLDIDKLMVSGGAKSGGITFKNLMSGTPLAVAGKMPGDNGKSVNTSPTVSYMLADGEGGSGSLLDGGGDSGLFTLHVHTNGGKMDEKGDLDTLLKRSKTKLTFTVDPDVKAMVVHSTATANSTVAADKRPKAGDYMNRVTFGKGDAIEELKVTGDALVYISTPYDNIRGSNEGLRSLRYVDARESSGGLRLIIEFAPNGLEVHGSSANDVIMGGSAGDDKLMGYDGDDVLIGLNGSDTITGGAGGDVLLGGQTSVDIGNQALLLLRNSGTASEHSASTAVDTFIYNAASDSRIDLDKMTGFDRIDRFDQGVDKIKLSSVPGLDLRGTIKNGNHGLNGASGGGDDFANTKSLKNFVTEHHKGGDGVFETSNTGELGNNKHSITLVTTREAKANFITLYRLDDNVAAINGNNITVTWVLVDVDGNGDFAAGTDMAIALIEPDGTLTAGDFI